MYRVIIVDDEPVIRNGISAFVEWEKEGLSVEDHYANGVEALAALESGSADILITDIKMPLMNGIQLMKQAIERYPWIKVVLISNYSDFEYVKEGLQLGAVDYLLKLTLNRDDLLAVLRRCISMLEEERRLDSELYHFQQGARYRERKMAEQEIKRLIVQEQTSSSSTAWAPAWLDMPYVCVYFMLDAAEEWRENYGYLYVQLMLEELQEMLYEQIEEGIAPLAAENSLFLIFPNNEGEVERQLGQWKKLLETKWGISISAGYAIEQGVHNILKGFADSRSACQRRFFAGLGGLYCMRESQTNLENTYTDAVPIEEWAPFFEIINAGDPVSFAVEFALERWKEETLSPEQVKHEAYSLLAGVNKLHTNEEALLAERYELLNQAETLEQLASILTCQLEEMEKSYIPKLTDNGYGGQLITKALEYIATHYTENLTQQSVADFVHLSKSYFSLLFKKQTDRNFIDYLIELRIREAKRLLAHNDSRVYDVAGAAGFKDVKYFSKVFKKVTGLSPIEYRDKHQAPETKID